VRVLEEEDIEEITAEIEMEGLEEWAASFAEEALRGTSVEPLLMKYLIAKDNLVLALRELGVDV
jgi:hypothetical protein